jgi:hypothetical protein
MESLFFILKLVAISYLLIAVVTILLFMLNTMIGFMLYVKNGGNGGLREYLIYLLDMSRLCTSVDARLANRANNSMSEFARFKGEEVEEDKTYIDVLNEDTDYWIDEVKEMSQREVLWITIIKPSLIVAIGWPAFSKTITSCLLAIKEGITGLINM